MRDKKLTRSDELYTEILKMKNGDFESYESFYNQSINYLWKLIFDIVRDEEVTNELIKDLYMNIYTGIGQLENTKDFFNWAGDQATNMAFAYVLNYNLDLVNGCGNIPLGGSVSELVSEDDDRFIPEGFFEQEELKNVIDFKIDELPSISMCILHKYYYHDRPVSEIADELGLSSTEVKKEISNVKNILKQEITLAYGADYKSNVMVNSMAEIPVVWNLFAEIIGYEEMIKRFDYQANEATDTTTEALADSAFAGEAKEQEGGVTPEIVPGVSLDLTSENVIGTASSAMVGSAFGDDLDDSDYVNNFDEGESIEEIEEEIEAMEGAEALEEAKNKKTNAKKSKSSAKETTASGRRIAIAIAAIAIIAIAIVAIISIKKKGSSDPKGIYKESLVMSTATSSDAYTNPAYACFVDENGSETKVEGVELQVSESTNSITNINVSWEDETHAIGSKTLSFDVEGKVNVQVIDPEGKSGRVYTAVDTVELFDGNTGYIIPTRYSQGGEVSGGDLITSYDGNEYKLSFTVKSEWDWGEWVFAGDGKNTKVATLKKHYEVVMPHDYDAFCIAFDKRGLTAMAEDTKDLDGKKLLDLGSTNDYVCFDFESYLK